MSVSINQDLLNNQTLSEKLIKNTILQNENDPYILTKMEKEIEPILLNQTEILFSSQTLGDSGVYILHAKLDNSRVLNKKFIK